MHAYGVTSRSLTTPRLHTPFAVYLVRAIFADAVISPLFAANAANAVDAANAANAVNAGDAASASLTKENGGGRSIRFYGTQLNFPHRKMARSWW
jgi:hypothetical protein